MRHFPQKQQTFDLTLCRQQEVSSSKMIAGYHSKMHPAARGARAEPAGRLGLGAFFGVGSELWHAAVRQSFSELFSLQPPVKHTVETCGPTLGMVDLWQGANAKTDADQRRDLHPN